MTGRPTGDVVATLRNTSVLGGLSHEHLERLIEGSEVVTLGSGEYLFEEGDEGDAAYVLIEGEAGRSRCSPTNAARPVSGRRTPPASS
jgi:CRP-like cAMP-binding protein